MPVTTPAPIDALPWDPPDRRPSRGQPGESYVLRICTLYRRPVFRDHDAARAVARLHGLDWPWRDATLHAWVLLPDSWQALLTLGEREGLPALLGRFKALSTRAVDARHRINGWLWGRGFSERRLGPGEQPGEAGLELVEAPLRAGLVARPGDYPYWDRQGGGPP